MLKKYLFIACSFLLVTNLAFGYEPLPPETIYSISENQQYLLQITPMSKQAVENIPYEIKRNSLTIIIYEKRSTEIEGVSETIYYWQEISFFRVKHPDSGSGGWLAETRQGIISNDGNRIMILSQINPMARIRPVNDIYVYDRSGNMLKSFTQEELFLNEVKDINSISMDENNYQMKVVSIEGEIKNIDLNNFKIK